MRIKIAMTTHNRYDVFKKSLEMWNKFLPKNAELIVVDDGSDIAVTEADFRFETPQGIAVAKNKCFELMGDADFYFLVDDDVYPITKTWWKPYTESGINHLCLGFDTFSNGGKNGHVLLKSENSLDYWKEPCGLLMMYTPLCLEKAGGMDPKYKKWSGEHQNLSQRIYNLGLTPHPFMDVKDGIKMFYSFDQHQSSERSVDADTRRRMWNQNKQLLVRDAKSLDFIPFKPLEDVYITTLFNHIVDPQRGEKWNADESVLNSLVASLGGAKLIVLTDSFEGEAENNVHFIPVQTVSNNPYWQRWISIKEHLENHNYNKVFICDGTDVVRLRDPFPHMHPGRIYLGDEQTQTIRNRWLMANHAAPIYQRMYNIGAMWRLLNAGLCGGYQDIVLKFTTLLVEHYFTFGSNDFTDMAGFNFIAYLHFKTAIVNGKQVNNSFKSYADNGVCWFKHK